MNLLRDGSGALIGRKVEGRWNTWLVDCETRFIWVEAARQLAHPDVKALIAAAIDQASLPLPSKGEGGTHHSPDGCEEADRPDAEGVTASVTEARWQRASALPGPPADGVQRTAHPRSCGRKSIPFSFSSSRLR